MELTGFEPTYLRSKHATLLMEKDASGSDWLVWHTPIFFIEGTFQATLGEVLGFWPGLGFWTLATMVFSVGFTWLFNSVGGSTLAAATLHGATNAWISWGLTDATPSESVVMFAWFVVLWVGVSAVLLLSNGARTLARSDHKIVSYVPTRPRDHAPKTALTS